jgi:hypothetical protein
MDKTTANYPVRLEVSYPERSSRLWSLAALFFFIKIIAIIPHAIILYILSFVTIVVFILSQLAILFTGRYPRFLFDFLVGIMRWQFRVNAFLFGLTDKYPPFTLSQ